MGIKIMAGMTCDIAALSKGRQREGKGCPTKAGRKRHI